jgi:hypothetical protein
MFTKNSDIRATTKNKDERFLCNNKQVNNSFLKWDEIFE